MAAIRLRPADRADLPALRALIPRSARELSRGFYTEAQTESAIRHVFGVDTVLVDDGTYLVAESEDGALVACGGWSRWGTLFGGDQTRHGADRLLDPATEAARIRAFFVDPGWARRGIGRAILEASATAAAAAGFRRLELMATLPGVPLYRRLGFQEEDRLHAVLPDGVPIEFVRMTRGIDAAPPPAPLLT